jgi:hypothetical protein
VVHCKASWIAIAVAATLAGCGSSKRPPGELPPDGGGNPPPDAGTGAENDGGPGPDGAPDASEAARATVTVYGVFGPEYGMPQAGIPVMFHTGAGKLIASTVTDAGGKASAPIPADAMVTIVRQFGPDDIEPFTRTHVQPGATLEFGSNRAAPTTIATMTVNWTTPPEQFIGHFDVVSPCGSAFAFPDQRSAQLPISSLCAGVSFPVYVISRDNADFIDQSGVNEQTAVDGGTINLTTWVGATDVSSEVTGIPDGALVIGHVEQASGRLTFTGGNGDVFGVPSGTMLYHLAPVAGSELYEDIGITSNSVDQTISRRGPFVASHTLDIGATLLPSITSAGFDVASRTLAWTTAAPVAADVQVLVLDYNRGSQTRSWSVVAPRELGNSFTIPELPADQSNLLPLATDRISGAVSQIKLGNGLTYAQVQANVLQWLFVGYPRDSGPISWYFAPPQLDMLIKSNALF